MTAGDGSGEEFVALTAPEASRGTVARPRVEVPWYKSLQFKLALIFGVLMGLCVFGAITAILILVGDGLVRQSFTFEEQGGQRLIADVSRMTQTSQDLAAALATLLGAGGHGRQPMLALSSGLVDHLPESPEIAAVGIWPEPGQLEAALTRASIYLVRDPAGHLHAREDYNDPRTIPYYREPWYTPARYAPANRCFWTTTYREPITQQAVVTCSTAAYGEHGFAGVVTVTMSLERLQRQLNHLTQDWPGYAVLVDRDNAVLALTGAALDKLGGQLPLGRNVAQLGQAMPVYEPLALVLQEQENRFLSAAVRSPQYDARQVSALRDATRDLSRTEAESALALITSLQAGGPLPAAATHLRLKHDPVLGEDAYASVFGLPASGWRLASVSPGRDGAAGIRYVVTQSMIAITGATLMLFILTFGAVRLLVIQPLRRMTHLLSDRSADDPLHVVLDATSSDEIGVLARWHNERLRELRDIMERISVTHQQLVGESAERHRLQSKLRRAHARFTSSFAHITDGVILVNEQGRVDDLNPAAERLIGRTRERALEQPFASVFPARLGADSGGSLPDLSEVALKRGKRLEYPDQIYLDLPDGRSPEMTVLLAPLRLENSNRVYGAVAVFRPRPLASSGAAPRRIERTGAHHIDAITGMGTRAACEMALAILLESESTSRGCLLAFELDGIERINRAGGLKAGDRALADVAEIVSSTRGDSSQVFRLCGDEFAVILPGADVAAGTAEANTLRQRLLTSTRHPLRNDTSSMAAHFGICPFGRESGTATEIIRRARLASATAREQGAQAPVIVYEPALEQARGMVDEEAWVRRIRRGLEENLFHLTTQWLLPANTLAAEGHVFEMLVALEDEEGFWTAPSTFFPIAERQGLAGEIDRWVINRTMSAMASEPEVVSRLAYCGLNLTMTSVRDMSTLEFLAEMLERYPSVAPQKICFEVNADDAATDLAAATRFLNALRQIGFRANLDHFLLRSTSDVEVLRRLPVDGIKLESSHYPRVQSDNAETMLAEAMLRIVHHLRKRATVCGLESEEDVAAWRKLGVDYYQGYVIAKPSPVLFAIPNA